LDAREISEEGIFYQNVMQMSLLSLDQDGDSGFHHVHIDKMIDCADFVDVLSDWYNFNYKFTLDADAVPVDDFVIAQIFNSLNIYEDERAK
jgi:hypothetical protein